LLWLNNGVIHTIFVLPTQLWNYYNTPGLFKPEKLFETDTTIHDAVVLLLRTWQLEQHHEEKSP
jgi:hypothetical protein